MRFSVVIPALNEAKRIQRVIKILSDQSVGRKNYEIVVIDSKSPDGTAKLAREAGADIVVSEKLKGTNFARQRGVEVSHGTIVAFLDADCEPRKDWLARIEYNLQQPGVAAVSGPYDYGFKGLKRFFANAFTNVLFPSLPDILFLIFGRKAGVMIGGNFAAWRTSIEKIGGLPPLAFWGDDGATAMLFSRHVGKVVFDTRLVVDSSPRRFEKEGMFKLQKKYSQAYFKVYFSKDYE
jgi:glycosyltransferase involved in cell wall biosynthesis